MTLSSWLSSETLMRKCFGGVPMIEEILLCLMKIIFSIAWVVTGRHLDGCTVSALNSAFFSWYCSVSDGSPMEVMSSGHYCVINK